MESAQHRQQDIGGTDWRSIDREITASARTIRDEALRLARRSQWLSRQAPEFQDALLKDFRIRRFEKGETIIALDSEATDLHFLLYGAVEMSIARPNLDLATIHIIPGRVWFGEHSALSRIRSFADYQARIPSTTLSISNAALSQLQTRFTFSTAFADLFALSLQSHCSFTGNLVGHTVEQRIRAKLLSLASLAEPPAGCGERSLFLFARKNLQSSPARLDHRYARH